MTTINDLRPLRPGERLSAGTLVYVTPGALDHTTMELTPGWVAVCEDSPDADGDYVLDGTISPRGGGFTYCWTPPEGLRLPVEEARPSDEPEEALTNGTVTTDHRVTVTVTRPVTAGELARAARHIDAEWEVAVHTFADRIEIVGRHTVGPSV